MEQLNYAQVRDMLLYVAEQIIDSKALLTEVDSQIGDGLFEPGKDPSYGALFFAEIREVGARPGDSEIEENGLFDEFPEAITYPHIQPKLMEQVRAWLGEGNFHSEEEDIFELLV